MPLLAELREKFLAWKEQLLPRHPMAEAISYALSPWQELNVFAAAVFYLEKPMVPSQIKRFTGSY